MTDIDELLAEQREYYRARADEYDDWWHRTGRFFRSDRHSVEWQREVAEAQAWLADRCIGGSVLELAAGTGNWTLELERHADSLTIVDSSAETLAINRGKLAEPDRVQFVVADVFEFEPGGRFDVVFFSFWLSHVPVERFERFWKLVDRCLEPDGRVVLIDSGHPALTCRAPDSGLAATDRSAEFVGHQGAISVGEGIAERELDDGSRHRIVKRYWMPDELSGDLAPLGWRTQARNTGYFFLLASLERAGGSGGGG